MLGNAERAIKKPPYRRAEGRQINSGMGFPVGPGLGRAEEGPVLGTPFEA